MKQSLDSSQAQTFLDCQHKYHNRYIRQIRKIKDDEGINVDIDFGKVVHKCLERYYKDKMEGQFDETIEKYLNPLAGLVENLNNKVKTQVSGEKLVRDYISTYHNQERDHKILGVEVIDEVDIGVPYTVKIDKVYMHRDNVYVEDFKTSQAKSKKYFFSRYDMDAQMSGYCYWAERKYGSCSGFYVNGLFIGYRQRAYKGEPAGLHTGYERQLFNRYPQQLTDWRQNILKVLVQIEECKKTGDWLKNTANCSRCEFKMLCVSCDDSEIESLHYEKYDPYQYLKEDTDGYKD